MRLLRFRRHPVSDQELSAYLDGRLPARARARVDSHLQSCDGCSRKLEEMRLLLAGLRRLPEVKVPRSFALTPAMAAEARPRPEQTRERVAVRRAYLGLSGATVAAALLLIGIVAGTSLISSNSGSAPPGTAASRQQAASSDEKSAAPVAPNPATLGSNQGGSGGTPGLEMTANPLPGSSPGETQNLPPAVPMPPTAGPSNEDRSFEETPNALAPSYGLQNTPAPTPDQTPSATPPQQSIAATQQAQSQEGSSHLWQWLLEGISGALIIVFGASALWMRRRWNRLNRSQ